MLLAPVSRREVEMGVGVWGWGGVGGGGTLGVS